MRIDCHMHAFADKIVTKATGFLEAYYGIPVLRSGTLDDFLTVVRDAQLNAAVLLVAATHAGQVKPAHDWLLGLPEELLATSGAKIIRFGTYHVDDPHWMREIARLRQAGVKGIKLHPDFQKMDLADVRLDPFFEEVQNDFTLLIHAGDPASPLSRPHKFLRILMRFPRLKIIAAHMGGYRAWDEALDCLAGKSVYLETSSSLAFMDDEKLLRALIHRHGTDRILMGSDYPMITPTEAMELIEKRLSWLPVSAREDIMGRNAAQLLEVPAP